MRGGQDNVNNASGKDMGEARAGLRRRLGGGGMPYWLGLGQAGAQNLDCVQQGSRHVV